VLLDLNHGSGAVYGRLDHGREGAVAVTARVNAAIDAALLARHRRQTPRDYLGGSRVGEPCERCPGPPACGGIRVEMQGGRSTFYCPRTQR